MTDRYAVVGNPVAHSLSPQIHAAFARQTAQDIEYGKLLAPLDAFTQTVQQFRAGGGCGVNVTVPFKFEAFRLCTGPDETARAAQAVNTLHFDGDRILGFNTDGVGLVTDLERNLGFPLHDRRVLVLGAGGATYGVMQPILQARPREVVIANRTLDKAVALVNRFQQAQPVALAAKAFGALAGSRFDLVINATSAGLANEMPPLPRGIFAEGALAYDMVYATTTPFMAFAQNEGARTADGLGMLVEQAAQAFFIWRGVRPQTAPVLADLRAR